jgi:hypothetical protein
MSLLDRLRERVRLSPGHTDLDDIHTNVFPPITAEHLKDAEARLGFDLPSLLRDIYVGVGNGGFGPGDGLIGIDCGLPFHPGIGTDLVGLYHSFRRYRTHDEPWAERLLPICHWGCSYFSYIDCALPSAPVLAFDENAHGHGPCGCAFGLHAASFEEWMERWISGEVLWKSFNAIGAPKFWFEEHPDGFGPSP